MGEVMRNNPAAMTFIAVVFTITLISSLYQMITFVPEERCIDGILYEKEYDGDYEPIVGFNGRYQPCEETENNYE